MNVNNTWRIHSKGTFNIHLQALKLSSLYLIKTRIKCQSMQFHQKKVGSTLPKKAKNFETCPSLSECCWGSTLSSSTTLCLPCTANVCDKTRFYRKWFPVEKILTKLLLGYIKKWGKEWDLTLPWFNLWMQITGRAVLSTDVWRKLQWYVSSMLFAFLCWCTTNKNTSVMVS